MRGRPRKIQKKKANMTSRQKRNPSPISPQAAEEASPVSGSDVYTDSQSTLCSLPCTPKRCTRATRKTQEAFHTDSLATVCSFGSTPKKCMGRPRKTPEAFRTSTPLHRLSTKRLANICDIRSEEEDGKNKKSEVESPCDTPRSQNRKRSIEAAESRRLRKKLPVTQTTSSPAKRRCSKNLKNRVITPSSSEPSRPRFELKEDESLLSSDLPTELSDHKEQMPLLSFPEDEESVDEEELPSFLMQTRPLSITEGVFVWCKFRRFPTWPALVKQVNRKAKKASIIFIDDQISRQKRGVIVALKSLKPFDCEGANELAAEAKEEWATKMKWSLELITDYRIRIGNPVRNKSAQGSSKQLTIAGDSLMEEEGQWEKPKEDCEEQQQQQEEVNKCAKRLLPDRTQAAHNRANEKLVHFVIKRRMVEGRLLAVIRGQVQSRWLRYFQRSDNRFFGVETYLEDNTQLDKMFCYLTELYETAVPILPGKPAAQYMERIPFVLDVLLPEAITYAIAGMDNISIKKAEEKYLKGRCLSNREIQDYELMIERLCMRKS
ncbi:PWWP domain-containing DNA repair factor 3A-like isoform X2 [Hippocampus zosterae]|uniref:PWWP domain-containing DNA repair factor 3A-like isoform X2 n=1 Tax=Hippocampus zosterae TaxID=109293 RepID=UPI00223D61EB|nr:PWWP domain-containing DNA repair factor 3A-like isoform X2 [Hippocampus zosterae]